MNKLKFLTILFFVLFIISLPLSTIWPRMFSTLLLIEDLIIFIGIFFFLKDLKVKRIGKIRVESVQYPFTYVLRAYTSPKKMWIVFDEKTKRFRPADFRDTPIRVFLIILLGSALMYTSYLIAFTITQVPILIPFRIIVLFLFFFMGLYSISLSIYRLFSLKNKNADTILRFLNREKMIIDMIKKGKLYVHVTPNFLLKDGFVDSIEFILVEKLELDRLEKILIETARMIQKL